MENKNQEKLKDLQPILKKFRDISYDINELNDELDYIVREIVKHKHNLSLKKTNALVKLFYESETNINEIKTALSFLIMWLEEILREEDD